MGHPPDLSYCELRNKEIINTVDGRRLGRIVDIIFSSITGEVRGIIAPFMRRVFFGRNQEVFIPWNCINKIGDDVILVAVVLEGSYNMPRDRRMNFDKCYYGDSGGGFGGGSARVCGNENINYDRHNTENSGNSNENKTSYEQQYKDAYVNSQKNESASGNNKNNNQNNFNNQSFSQNNFNSSQNNWDNGADMPKCDRKCEKCMLFDCAYRWK